ncbi:MAG: Fe-S cluster assembly sulfur transfer protein SufU [Bacteroidota bacterium]
MDDQIKQLYQEIILVQNKNPYHFVDPLPEGVRFKAYNPICGDSFEVSIEMVQEQIKEAWFYGHGCAISKASASVLVASLENKSVEEGIELVQEFLALVKEGDDQGKEVRKEFQAFTAAKNFPGRMSCATLVWEEALKWLTAGG